MKIISIHRDTDFEGLPDVFTVGSVPTIDGEAVEHNPVVKTILFYEIGITKAYRGPCYLISFVDSNVKRIIPAGTMIEIAYEVEKEVKEQLEKPKKAETTTIEATE